MSIPKRDLETKKTTPNIEVWPESLGAMLEYWYIERGLLETCWKPFHQEYYQCHEIEIMDEVPAREFAC